jgi:hypothetical protein
MDSLECTETIQEVEASLQIHQQTKYNMLRNSIFKCLLQSLRSPVIIKTPKPAFIRELNIPKAVASQPIVNSVDISAQTTANTNTNNTTNTTNTIGTASTTESTKPTKPTKRKSRSGQPKSVINKTGYIGVTRLLNGKYSTAIRICTRLVYLGTSLSPQIAARMYDKAAFELRGGSARLNFPEEYSHRIPFANPIQPEHINRFTLARLKSLVMRPRITDLKDDTLDPLIPEFEEFLNYEVYNPNTDGDF